MKSFRVALFDVDGVLVIPPELFSQQYCEKYGVDPALQTRFYATKEFKDSTVGKFDLKDAIRMHGDLWKWSGEPEELLQMWFDGENYPNQELLEIVSQLRQEGALVYLATQQEKYRAEYLKEVVFKDKFDGIFCSCDIGYGKHEDHFWKNVLSQLGKTQPGITPSEIVYFDDRQSLVDKAKEFGIQAYLYENLESVAHVL